MTTLIIVKKSGGRIVGRCDATCYDARTPECTCVCGGKNHGIGLQKAAEQVSQYTEAQLQALTAKGALVPYTPTQLKGLGKSQVDERNPTQGKLL